MRPLVLAALLVALAGCSKPYLGKTFEAIEKPHHMAEGEGHKINDHPSEVESSPSHEEQKGGTNFTITRPVEGNPVPTASAFPVSAQPTGKPPVIQVAPSEAGATSEPVHE